MCAIFNLAIMLILWGVEKQKLLFKVQSLLDNQLELPPEINEVLNFEYTDANRDQLTISGYAPDTLKIAFWGFLTTDNYLVSIRKVMELGKDTDTFAAVTGALAGSYYGYEHIRKQVKEELVMHNRIKKIAEDFFCLNLE
jgi:ADP-ribosylglycohydrolase